MLLYVPWGLVVGSRKVLGEVVFVVAGFAGSRALSDAVIVVFKSGRSCFVSWRAFSCGLYHGRVGCHALQSRHRYSQVSCRD